VAGYAPGAIGHVGQRLVEQFAGNVEQLLETQAGAVPVITGPPRPGPRTPGADRRLLAASALLLAGGALAAGALAALAVWRRHRHPGLSLPPDTPWYFSHEGARHG
jgi:hypothetical protein